MAFYRANMGGSSPSPSGYSQAARDVSSASSSKTISNKSGKTLLLLVFMYSSSSLTYNRYDTITVSGGTATKISNLTDSNAYGVGTFFELKVTSDTCTITSSYNMRIIAFENS